MLLISLLSHYVLYCGCINTCLFLGHSNMNFLGLGIASYICVCISHDALLAHSEQTTDVCWLHYKTTLEQFPGKRACCCRLCNLPLHLSSAWGTGRRARLGHFPLVSSREPARIWREFPAGAVDSGGLLGFVNFLPNDFEVSTVPWVQMKSENLNVERDS